jgi:ribose transport system ATP-binding protein
LIVGRTLDRYENVRQSWKGAVRVEARDLTVEDVGPVSFQVAQGEIVGLVGLRGAGHERVGRALFGALPFSGTLQLDGAPVAFETPAEAMHAGIGLIARDRVEESTLSGLSIRENTFANPDACGRNLLSLLSPQREGERARVIGTRVGLKPNEPELPIEALSGGNQQKVIVGRWLEVAKRLLIAEDPTAGVDVGAKAEIYRLLEAALESGLGVVVVSTDFEEVARLCHRALVFSRGLIVAELAGADLRVEQLIHAASVAVTAVA